MTSLELMVSRLNQGYSEGQSETLHFYRGYGYLEAWKEGYQYAARIARNACAQQAEEEDTSTVRP